ncbi:hypothetical protein [Metabacillus rhizolycopersici]|uniref:HNH endonuclease n=1 Tax=Metabacillus rhizolycopersici TaxID=2875709 RepID=A0ABS7UTP9_9BACI|nr:hypothetical protein [Metabacillus rhizolycopersici]MBZ5751345.1 hypothetical protein [Metabacillus rhizolycopersici]
MKKQTGFILQVNWKPSAYHYHTVRKAISQTLWKKIRLQVLDAENKTCCTCGYVPNGEGEIKKLHVHEIEEYSDIHDDELICTLKGLNLICVKCHSFHHWGRTVSVLSKDQIDGLIEHFMMVNQCTKDDFMEHYREVREDKGNQILEYLQQFKKVPDIKTRIVKFKIDGEIPYKDEVVAQLKKKGLYSENL